MNDQTNATETNLDHTSHRGRRRGRHGFLSGLLLGALGAGLVGYAIGATMPVAEAAIGAFAHHGGDRHPTLEQAQDKAEFFVGFALHRLDATPDQEVRVQELVGQAIEEFYPVMENHRAKREEFRQILGAPSVDRAAIETLRVEEIALVEDLSRALTSLIADTADVLTVEQRQELLERMDRFRHDH